MRKRFADLQAGITGENNEKSLSDNRHNIDLSDGDPGCLVTLAVFSQCDLRNYSYRLYLRLG